ncbi:MAG: ATP-dependent DNA helicase RecQ [Bacteroidota bacterium]|nr:ATP-dependent DNA helicase RecQ [Bacteroidota bacterium]
MKDPGEILKEYWGYNAFRPLQREIINSVLGGHDTLAIMPTGGGKSICFQVPSMVKEGICLVISPLIALMQDQVLNLKKKGIPSLAIYSGMSFFEIKKTLRNAAYGNFKFLYVSPERLETELFLEFISSIKINLIAVDEAHCISQWGYDFRPPYLHIADIREYFPNIPILALTASATLEVQEDICNKLVFKKDAQSFHQSFERANLSYSAFNLSSKENKLIHILKKVPGSGIVYCKSRKRTKEIAELLNSNEISADFYHAGLSNDERKNRQENWVNNKTRIISCTNAFGMGIDKPDVRSVIHYDVPDALENYYQEAGRAGRDEKKAYAVLFYNERELNELRKQADIRYPTKEVIRTVYAAICNYFQLPSGSGEGISYDFDINSFVKKFKLEAYLVNNVLKILEQEELIIYNEQFFSLSTVVFTVTKSELEEFEKSYPHFEEIVKGLLRLYEGIFDFPCSINETQLAKFITLKKEKLVASLNKIKQIGIIDYIPQKEKPQIMFLQNRVNAKDLMINEKNISERKQAFEKRLSAMMKYTKNQSKCRSKMIAGYFNEHLVRRCGVCDNCIRDKKIIITNEEFEAIKSSIEKIVGEKSVSLIQLYQELNSFNQAKIKKILNYLQEENKIKSSKEGLIGMR